jgi:tight adherence protein B
MTDPIIIGAVVALVIVVAIVAYLFTRSDDEIIDERLERMDQVNDFSFDMDEDEAEAQQQQQNVSVLDESRRILDPFNNFLSNRALGQGVRKKLARANVKLTVAEYFIAQIASATLAFLLGYMVLIPGDIVTSSIIGVIGYFVPRIYVGREISQRLKKFEEQLPDTIGLWVNALRSGYSVLQAMEAISNDAPEPTQGEFKRVVKEVQLGIDMDRALHHLVERIQSEDLDLVVTAVNIQREVGGNLAEILDVISHTIRERIKLKGEIRVLTSQGRATGYIISALPILLAIFLQITQQGYMGQMFEHRTCGWPMIGLGLAMIGMGAAAIQKIVDIDI